MTILLALLGGGTLSEDEGFFWDPYIIGGGVLVLLLGMLLALLAFGKGREHS